MSHRYFGWLFNFLSPFLWVAPLAVGGTSSTKSPSKALPPFRVGVFLPASGPVVDYGTQARQGIDFGAFTLKQKGARIELFFEDSLGTPTGTSLAVNKLLSTHKVHLLLGEMTTANTDAALAPAITANVPLISLGSTYGPLIKDKPLVHLVSVTDGQQAKIMARFAKNTLNAKSAAIFVNQTSDYSKDMAQEFSNAFLSLGKKQKVFPIPLGENVVSYAPYIRKLKKNNKYPDVIFMPLYYDQAGPILHEMATLKVPSKILGSDGFDSPELISLSKGAANGVFFVSHYTPDSAGTSPSPFVKGFTDFIKKAPGTFSVLGYDALTLAFDAYTRSKGATGPALAQEIANTQNFQGAAGSLSMDKNTRLPIKDAYIMTLKEGEKKLVSLEKGQ